jgi:hypothetical protein
MGMKHGLRRLLTAGAAVPAMVAASLAPASAAHADVPSGTLVVVITDSLGAPVVGARLLIAPTAGAFDMVGGPSNADGTITATGVWARTDYRLEITTPGGLVDYVPGKATAAEAGHYSVLAGETTTVTEQLSQSGNVVVSLVDRVTGKPVGDGCVGLSSAPFDEAADCDHPDGRYVFVAAPLGKASIVVSGSSTHWSPGPVWFAVTPGTVSESIPMAPAVAIRTVIQAADDPSAHPRFCVQPVYPVDTLLNGGETPYCSDPTTGSLTIGPLVSVPVQLFAYPEDYLHDTPFAPVYGAQWVGASGGTGDQRLARTFDLAAGPVVDIAPIRVDHAGSITGVVTTQGINTTEIAVRPYAPQVMLHLNYGPGLGTVTTPGSSYQLNGLGPYDWPVLFQDWQDGWYAEQWSGGAANRYEASMVPVKAGGTATVNATMVATSWVAGTFTSPPAPPPITSWLMATNAVTGDWTGYVYINGDVNGWQIAGLNTDPVRLLYNITGELRQYPFAVYPGVQTGMVLANARPVSRPDPASLYGVGHVRPPIRPIVRGTPPPKPPAPTSPMPTSPTPTSPPPLAPTQLAPLSGCASREPRCL